jgi:O-antigen/teichoic acid export membrane protein
MPGNLSNAEDGECLAPNGLPDSNLRAEVIRGSAWVAAWRWSVRLISICSTLVLARLLTPHDFGVFTMALVIVSLIEMFSETGQAAALVRIGRPTRKHFDTAWTIQVIIGLFLALCVLGAAPLAGRYYDSSEVENVLYFVSLRCALGGFVNIAVAIFRINLEFDKEFRMAVIQRLVNLVVAMTLAAVLRNYWALAITFVGEKLVAIIVTYWMRPYLPRFAISKFGEIWSFSVWMMVAYISEYAGRRLDELLIGGLTSASAVGQYDLAAECARAPIYDVLDPMSRALFPIYTQFSDDIARLKQAYLNVLSVAATVSLSAGIGLANVAHDFVDVVLSQSWQGTGDLLVWLAIGATGLGLTHGVGTVMNVTSRTPALVAAVWIRIVALVPAVFVGFHLFGVPGIAAGQALVQLFSVLLWFYVSTWAIPLNLGDILSRIWRPAVASIIMTLAIAAVSYTMPQPSLARLVITIVSGATTFGTFLGLLWWVAGYPDGFEEVVASAIRRLLRGRRAALVNQRR